MKKTKQITSRFLVLLLAVCMIAVSVPTTAWAASDVTKWNGSRTISEHIYVKKPIEITGTGVIDVTGFYGIIRSKLYYQDNTPMITIKSGANIAFKNVYIGGVSWGDASEENEDKESRSSLIYVEPGARLTLYNVDVFGNDKVASYTTQGGAIYNDGILGLDDTCNIRYCSADVGGGIYNGENATLYMFGDSTVKNVRPPYWAAVSPITAMRNATTAPFGSATLYPKKQLQQAVAVYITRAQPTFPYSPLNPVRS